MMTPHPYFTIVRLEREAQNHQPRYLREFEDVLLEARPAPAAKKREPRRLSRLVLSLRAFLF